MILCRGKLGRCSLGSFEQNKHGVATKTTKTLASANRFQVLDDANTYSEGRAAWPACRRQRNANSV